MGGCFTTLRGWMVRPATGRAQVKYAPSKLDYARSGCCRWSHKAEVKGRESALGPSIAGKCKKLFSTPIFRPKTRIGQTKIRGHHNGKLDIAFVGLLFCRVVVSRTVGDILIRYG